MRTDLLRLGKRYVAARSELSPVLGGLPSASWRARSSCLFLFVIIICWTVLSFNACYGFTPPLIVFYVACVLTVLCVINACVVGVMCSYCFRGYLTGGVNGSTVGIRLCLPALAGRNDDLWPAGYDMRRRPLPGDLAPKPALSPPPSPHHSRASSEGGDLVGSAAP